MTVVMRAREGEGGIVLATDDIVKPTKSVSASGYPTDPTTGGITVPNGNSRTYTYIIRLERLSPNEPSQLTTVYDILPAGFSGLTYVNNSSKLRVDGGSWENFGNPLVESSGYGGQVRLRWPASGNFTSPVRDFAVRQVKELQFQVTGSLPSNSVNVNWTVLDPWDTLSGPQSKITVGSPSNPNIWGSMGGFEVGKTVVPDIIPPGEPTEIQYTLTIINHNNSTEALQEVTDYLPSGFNYVDNSTGGNITTNNPQGWPNIPTVTLNGVERQVLRWTSTQIPPGNKSFSAGQTKTLTFRAMTTKDVSGSYYNEFEAWPDLPVPKIVYEIIGPTTGQDAQDRTMWNTSYSWNTGTVLVPYYDSRADAEEVVIDSNFGLTEGGIAIKSWQVY